MLLFKPLLKGKETERGKEGAGDGGIWLISTHDRIGLSERQCEP